MFENACNNIDLTMRNDEGLASELDDLEQERQDQAKLERYD